MAYLFLPRHLTVASTFGVGVPAFFLALAPSSGAWRAAGFLRDVARFAVPAGVAVGGGVLAAYLAALHVAGLPVTEARTVSTTVLLAGMLFLLVALERRPARRRRAVEMLAAVMVAGYAGVLLVPPVRAFFALAAPTAELLALAAGGSAVAWTLAPCGISRMRIRSRSR